MFKQSSGDAKGELVEVTIGLIAGIHGSSFIFLAALFLWEKGPFATAFPEHAAIYTIVFFICILLSYAIGIVYLILGSHIASKWKDGE